jgi:hypothetical protein
LANFSPGFEHRENPGNKIQIATNPERVTRLANPFRVRRFIQLGLRCSNDCASDGQFLCTKVLRFETAVTAIYAAKCKI